MSIPKNSLPSLMTRTAFLWSCTNYKNGQRIQIQEI
jgi:hypothetical protein